LELKNAFEVDLTIKVFDQLGRLIIENREKAPKGIFQKKIDLSKYASGIYFVHLFNGKTTKHLPVIKSK
jgi:hypothetical protein